MAEAPDRRDRTAAEAVIETFDPHEVAPEQFAEVMVEDDRIVFTAAPAEYIVSDTAVEILD